MIVGLGCEDESGKERYWGLARCLEVLPTLFQQWMRRLEISNRDETEGFVVCPIKQGLPFIRLRVNVEADWKNEYTRPTFGYWAK
jgi:hypothetical protein